MNAKSRIFLTRSITAHEPAAPSGEYDGILSTTASVKRRSSESSVVDSIRLRTYRTFTCSAFIKQSMRSLTGQCRRCTSRGFSIPTRDAVLEDCPRPRRRGNLEDKTFWPRSRTPLALTSSCIGLDVASNLLLYPRCRGGLSDTAIRPSVCPRLGYMHAGCVAQLPRQSARWLPATRDVRTADPSADGRRSATSRTATGGGTSSRRPRGDNLSL